MPTTVTPDSSCRSHQADCQLAIATFGELNDAKDNAIVVPTWYSGTHQIWREAYIGPDHALNPDDLVHRFDQPNRQRSVHGDYASNTEVAAQIDQHLGDLLSIDR